MGLLIQVQVDTPEGLTVSSLYCKITGMLCDVLSREEVRVVVKTESYVSREKKNEGFRKVANQVVPETYVFTLPLLDQWGSFTSLYTKVKESLQAAGLAVEDVLEPAPTLEG